MQENNNAGYPQQMITPQNENDGEMNLKRILMRILGAWPIVLSSIIVALTLAFLINRYATRIYEVKAVIMVKSDKQGGMGMESLMSAVGYYNPRLDFENEVVILNSRSIVKRTLAKLPFELSYFGEGRIKAAEIYPDPGWSLEYDSSHIQTLGAYKVVQKDGVFEITSPDPLEGFTFHQFDGKLLETDLAKYTLQSRKLQINEWWETPFFRLRLVSKESENEINKDAGQVKVVLESKENLVDKYYKKVSIEPTSEGSAGINLAIEGAVPEKAQDYLDELIRQYQYLNLETKNKATEGALSFISKELKHLQDSLDQVEAILERFQADNEAIDLSQKGTQLFEEIFSLEKELTILKSQRKYFSYLEEYVAGKTAAESVVAPVAMGVEST